MKRQTKKIEVPENLKELYIGKNLSLSDLASLFGVSVKTTHRWIQRKGIKPHQKSMFRGPLNKSWKGQAYSNGRVFIKIPTHPRANTAGYVARSILVWERHHKKPVPKNHEIHHKNETNKVPAPFSSSQRKTE